VVDGIFMEVHDNPDNAKCDGSCMLRLDKLETLLRQLIDIRQIMDKYPE
jgi:2-dehydro-3-deoxyphosphooctonate aldolase (KDO 8-P synthase)